jgi:non-heme chloroperoxidase
MKSNTIWILAATAVLGNGLHAQGITGTWQGTITAGGESYRQVLTISKAPGGWRARDASIDLVSEVTEATGVTFDAPRLTIVFPAESPSASGATYEGKVSADGRSITGTLIQAEDRFPLDFRRVTAKSAWPVPPPHTTRFITVDTNVKLEVLDWGGSGQPVVFLTGLGNDAHVFDTFAPKFTPAYHVYAISRRGFGASSSPAFTTTNYAADRLGDDVLAVIESLGLRRPVLVGHSIAGEELSSIGSRHPEKVAGLIYLDAGYSYALYDSLRGDWEFDRQDLLVKLQQLELGRLAGPAVRTLLHALRDSILPRFEREVDQRAKDLDAMPPSVLNAQTVDTAPSPTLAIIEGGQKYTNIRVPILAIFALPHRREPQPDPDSATNAAMQARDDSVTATSALFFEHGVPSARVVRIANATHYVFRSNESEVLREMNAFLAGLPR